MCKVRILIVLKELQILNQSMDKMYKNTWYQQLKEYFIVISALDWNIIKATMH